MSKKKNKIKLSQDIEILRERLHQIAIQHNGDLYHDEVQEASRALDELIVQYLKT